MTKKKKRRKIPRVFIVCFYFDTQEHRLITNCHLKQIFLPGYTQTQLDTLIQKIFPRGGRGDKFVFQEDPRPIFGYYVNLII